MRRYGDVYCERCQKRLTKSDDILKPRFIRGEKGSVAVLFCQKCRKIFDERSEKENNDIFGMVNK